MMEYFCGYPVQDYTGDLRACGKPATPGCAFCDEHGVLDARSTERLIECCDEHRLPLIDGRCSECRDAEGNTFVLDMQSKVLLKIEEAADPRDSSKKFGGADSLAMDTGHGDYHPPLLYLGDGKYRPLTEEEIIDRAAQRQHDSTILLSILAICIVSAISLYQPIHTWLHAHLELLGGIVIGSVLEAWMWVVFCRCRLRVKR